MRSAMERATARSWRAALCAAALCASLAACGGGGGGGGSGGGTPTPPPTTIGGFTLSTNAVNLSAKRNGVPTPQSITLTLTDNGSASIVAGYATGVAPASWLSIDVAGSGQTYTFTFAPSTTALAAGSYTTTVTIATRDAVDRVLASRDVQVRYEVREGVIATTPTVQFSDVAGGPVAIRTVPITVTAPSSLQWRATSSASWLTPPAGGTGDATVNASIDASALPVGTATATLRFENVADASDFSTLEFAVTMNPPTLTASVPTLVLGGESGLEAPRADVTFSLGTGARSHPWTLTASTQSGGNWLATSASSGVVSASGAQVTVSANTQGLAGGIYTGQLQFTATVNGQPLTQTVGVTLRYESNRLLVEANGVAFSSFPARQVLARSLKVRDTRDEGGAAWTATADQPWLSVTPSGTTGNALTLTASPTGLAPGFHVAQVTIASASARTVNTETVRVGFTIGTVDPPVRIDAAGAASASLAANPVEPEAYAASGGDIRVYDVYAGALLRTLPSSGGNVLALAASGDGRQLFVLEEFGGAMRLLARNPATGATELNVPLLGLPVRVGETSLLYARPDTRPIVLETQNGNAVDVATGVLYGARVTGGATGAISADQRSIYLHDSGISPSTLRRYELRYGTLAASQLVATQRAINRGNDAVVRSNGRDVALSPDGTRVYAAAGSPYRFDVLTADTLVFTGFLDAVPFPSNVEACWNGRVAGGSDASGEPAGDIWIYDDAGALLTRLDSGNDALFANTLRFSGDCTRLVSGSASVRVQSVP